MEVIDLDPQGHFGHFDLEFQEIWLVCMITCNGYFNFKYIHIHYNNLKYITHGQVILNKINMDRIAYLYGEEL